MFNNTSEDADGFAIARISQAIVAVGFHGWRRRRQMDAEVRNEVSGKADPWMHGPPDLF